MYDVIIVGAGPAGITAGIYGVRYGLEVLLLDPLAVGGRISSAQSVENYPGFKSISGIELMETFVEHAKETGVSFQLSSVERVTKNGDIFEITADSGTLHTKAVIIATGAVPRHLGIPGEDEFIGRGVSYCATCDGPFFSGKEVAVIGGGESAVTDALMLSDLAKRVIVIHRRDTLRASQILQDRAFERENIDFVCNTVCDEIQGDKLVNSLLVRNVDGGEQSTIPVQGVFIYVGVMPSTGFVDVKKNEQGFIVTNEYMETSVPGLFAAGDCRNGPLYQIITAAADGAIAAFSAWRYIKGQ